MSVSALKALATFDPYWEGQPSSAQVDLSLRRPPLKETYNARKLIIAEKIAVALQVVGLIGLISLQFISSSAVFTPILCITAGLGMTGVIVALACSIWNIYADQAQSSSVHPEKGRVARISDFVFMIFEMTGKFLNTVALPLTVRLMPLATPTVIIISTVWGVGFAVVMALIIKNTFSDFSRYLAEQKTAV